jgi:predicted RND superfamily exporter protein
VNLLGRLLVRFRWLVLAGVVALVALVGGQVPQLRDDLSFETLYLSGDPEIKFSDDFSETFESVHDMVVVVLTGDEVFKPKMLNAVEEITDCLDDMDNVDNVYSLGNIRYIQGKGDDLDVGEFLPEVPTDPRELVELKAKAEVYKLFKRRLLSEDGAYTGVVAQTADVFEERADRREFMREIERSVAKLVPAGCKHYVTGMNVLEKDYAELIARDRVMFLGLAAAVIVAGFLLIFRSLIDTGVALAALLCSGAVSLGAIHLAGGIIDIVGSTVLPMILVVGTSDAIHMVAGFHEGWTPGRTGREAAARMVGVVGFACLMTSLTTMLGFGSLYFALIGTIKRFGLHMVISVAVTYVVSLAVITALLSFRGRPRAGRAERRGRDLTARFLARLADFVVRRPRAVVAGGLLMVLLAGVGLALLEVNSFAVSELKETHPTKVAILETENLAGFLGFELSVRSRGDRKVLEPDVLRKVDRLAAYVDSRPETIATWSVVDYLKEMNKAAEGGKAEHYRVPDSVEGAEQDLLLYTLSPEGLREINALVSSDRKWLRVVSRVHDIGAKSYLALVDDTDAQAREIFGEGGDFEVRVTSESFLLHRAMDRMVVDLAKSIALAFGFVFVAMLFSLRSWRLGLLSIIPNVLPLLATLAFMGLVGIPLRVGTIVVFSIGLGIAVDDTIHYFLRFRRCLALEGNYAAAVRRTHSGVGRPIIFTSLVLIGGFMAFVPSEFLSIRQMGILNAFTLAVALTADLTISPVLLRLLPVGGKLPAEGAAQAAPEPVAGEEAIHESTLCNTGPGA